MSAQIPGRCQGRVVTPEVASQGLTLLPRPAGGGEAASTQRGWAVAELLPVLPSPKSLPGQVVPDTQGTATLDKGPSSQCPCHTGSSPGMVSDSCQAGQSQGRSPDI